jgi:hypothetical protein
MARPDATSHREDLVVVDEGAIGQCRRRWRVMQRAVVEYAQAAPSLTRDLFSVILMCKVKPRSNITVYHRSCCARQGARDGHDRKSV